MNFFPQVIPHVSGLPVTYFLSLMYQVSFEDENREVGVKPIPGQFPGTKGRLSAVELQKKRFCLTILTLFF